MKTNRNSSLLSSVGLIIFLLFAFSNLQAANKFKISKLPIFDKLLCRDEDFSFIEFDNFTLDKAKIDSIVIIGRNASEFIIEDYNDIYIPANQKTRLKIQFKPESDGKKIAEMLIYSNELDDNIMGRYSVELFSEKYTFDLEFEKELLDFGEIQPDSIVEQTIFVRNTGSILIEFPKTPIKIGNFEIYEISPRLLQPWNNSSIDGIIKVRFNSSIEGNFFEEFKFKDLCNDEYSFKVKANVKKKLPPLDKVSFAVENYEAKSGQDIAIKFKILNYYVLKSMNLTRLISKIKFNNTILHPIEDTPIGVIDDNLRIINLELDISKDSVFNYNFKVALGNDSSTKLEIYDTYSPGFINNIENISGEFKLVDLCYADGPRLINMNNIINLSISTLNDDFAEITYKSIENGHSKILIFDYYGNLIESIIDKELSIGEHIFLLNLQKYGSGIYYVYLQTPTFRRAYNINLIR